MTAVAARPAVLLCLGLIVLARASRVAEARNFSMIRGIATFGRIEPCHPVCLLVINMRMIDSAHPTPRWRRHLGYVNWLFNPFQRHDAQGIYDLLSTGSPTERGLYLNLGYWRRAATIDEASEALARLVAEAAGMGPGDTVLDCGFGFGDQDILWAQGLRPARVVGLNITASQVALARRRIAEAGLGHCVDLLYGSATAMPIAASSVDAVVALESAFHFQTRERFFREAWRVLRPGGRLAVADIIPLAAASGSTARLQQRLSWWLVASKFAIPPENAVTRPVYHSKLALGGFEQVRVQSIRDEVYAPLHRYLAEHPAALRRLHPVARMAARFGLGFDAAAVYRGLDYVLATGVKPVSAGG